jgi:general secretion pathway protein G
VHSMTRKQHGLTAGRRAFTLIELLLVLVIISVLAAIVVPKLAGRGEDAKKKAAAASLHSIKTSLGIFESDNSRYPSTEEGLRALVERPGNAPNWRAVLEAKDVQADPWGNPWVYRYPGSQNPDGFDLYSTGPDGREGNDDIYP